MDYVVLYLNIAILVFLVRLAYLTTFKNYVVKPFSIAGLYVLSTVEFMLDDFSTFSSIFYFLLLIYICMLIYDYGKRG